MGSGRFDAHTYAAYSSTTAGMSTDKIYASRHLEELLDPHGVKVRESRDSADNPNSTPLIVALDVTGSMDMLADVIAREGLGTLFTSILDRKPIPDPHVMFMGIGDAACDNAPLQVSQFEAAAEPIIEQLTKLWLEKGGGGNDSESYNLPWYFAANHTVHDAYEKRGRRGYLFTVGDEMAPHPLTRGEINRFIGDTLQSDEGLESKVLLETVQRFYDVYHVVIEEGSFARHHLPSVMGSWTSLLGQRVIRLSDHKKLAEVIVSAIEVAEGRTAADSAALWKDDRTTAIVHEAVKNLPRGRGAPRLSGS